MRRCSPIPTGSRGLLRAFRAEDVTRSADLEDFVSLEEAARRMEISEDEVLALARSAFLFSRSKCGRLVIRPAIV
jgi:hypothetical protein